MAQRLERTMLGQELHRRGASALHRSKTNASQRTQASLLALRRRLPPMTQRVARRLPNSIVRRLASDDEFPVSAAFERDLQAQRGKGHPLEATVASSMGSSLGRDVSAVRIHTDEVADRMAGSIRARAFAQGKDLFFAHGEFDPHSESGRFTLAHELAHATDTHDRPASTSTGRTVVGSANDPAEAQADAVAQSAVTALRRQEDPEEEEEELQPLRRQEMPEEEEELQTLRRQEMLEEEEELQTLRRQEMPEEEEELQTLRRQEMPEEEEPVQALRRQEEEEEEIQPIRRRVTVDVLSQTATAGAIGAMTTVELRQQIASLETLPDLEDPQRENLERMQAELTRRESELEAASPQELDRECNRELSRLQRWLLSPGGLPLQTLRAYDGAVGNFVNFAGVSSPGGVQFSDVFGIVLAFIPGVGPVTRWVGQEALRAAMVAAAQAAAGAAVQRGTSMGAEASTAAEQRARADFAARARTESAALADTLARNVDGALNTYENAIDAAHRANNADGLRSLLVTLQHENDEVRSVDPAQYNELSRQFEIELYKRHYSRAARLINYIAPFTAAHIRYELRGIPSQIIDRLIGRGGLNAASSEVELARSWGLLETTWMDTSSPSLRRAPALADGSPQGIDEVASP
ncbi:MAG: DUF4157 domain-containing protein [Anaerolineae bacterium]|nr:DUF4157 domain-containing protein [Anaerolineae bacterium]